MDMDETNDANTSSCWTADNEAFVLCYPRKRLPRLRARLGIQEPRRPASAQVKKLSPKAKQLLQSYAVQQPVSSRERPESSTTDTALPAFSTANVAEPLHSYKLLRLRNPARARPPPQLPMRGPGLMQRAQVAAKITGQRGDVPKLPGQDVRTARSWHKEGFFPPKIHQTEMREQQKVFDRAQSPYDISSRRKTVEVVESRKLTSLETVQEDLQNMVTGFKTDQEEEKTAKTKIQLWELHGLAKTNHLDVNEVVFIKSVYDSYDTDGNGSLDKQEFQKVTTAILEAQLKDSDLAASRAESLISKSWNVLDKDGSGSINFYEFLNWFASSCFEEDVLLTEQERRLRATAKAFDIDQATVDKVKAIFDEFDSDKSGTVELNEFANILHKTIQVPRNFELPTSRIRAYWREIDLDGSGTIDFEEYLGWWLKHFSRNMTGTAGDSMYNQVRNMEYMVLDPPAYSYHQDSNAMSLQRAHPMSHEITSHEA